MLRDVFSSLSILTDAQNNLSDSTGIRYEQYSGSLKFTPTNFPYTNAIFLNDGVV